VLNSLFGNAFVSCMAAADANDDGRADISDPIYLLRWRFLGGPAPPPPFPECGLDPSPDDLACESFARCGQDPFVENSIGMRLEYLPPGSFPMGTENYRTGAEDNDEVPHEVTISRGFYLAATETTQAQYLAVMGENPSYHDGVRGERDFGNDPRRPVEDVSWHDAREFCAKLSQIERAVYRLPTEAEWEYACRAGAQSNNWRFWFAANAGACSDAICTSCEGLDGYFWWCGNSEDAVHPVAFKEPSPEGLHDMHGNVREWCEDWYGALGESPVVDPQGAETGSARVVRGGSYTSTPRACRAWNREALSPEDHYSNVGFRVVLVAH
jgi:formylglycine-generating enzyme required for sulfatase activity